MLSEHNKHEVRKIISEVFGIPVVSVMSGDSFRVSYSASFGMLTHMQVLIENAFNLKMGDCSEIVIVSDLYEHLDELID